MLVMQVTVAWTGSKTSKGKQVRAFGLSFSSCTGQAHCRCLADNFRSHCCAERRHCCAMCWQQAPSCLDRIHTHTHIHTKTRLTNPAPSVRHPCVLCQLTCTITATLVGTASGAPLSIPVTISGTWSADTSSWTPYSATVTSSTGAARFTSKAYTATSSTANKCTFTTDANSIALPPGYALADSSVLSNTL